MQIFVGSGLSAKHYPVAGELTKALLDERITVDGRSTTLREHCRPEKGLPLEDAAEFFELYTSPDRLVSLIRRLYGPDAPDRPEPDAIHRKLWRLPNVRLIYTTNYDTLIEDALARPASPPQVITGATPFRADPQRRRVVFKPHGCASTSRDRADFVVTRSDYLEYAARRPLDVLKTVYDLSTCVFLFFGYSLRDLNMRHMVLEANRTTRVRAYAVLDDVSGPEVEYWTRMGVVLIRADAESFVNGLLRKLRPEESEWQEKADVRVDEKGAIASKAVRELKRHAKHARKERRTLNVLLDAGSTTGLLARMLASSKGLSPSTLRRIRFITNSPVAMAELEPAILATSGMPQPVVIGGPLRHQTRAYTPSRKSARGQMAVPKLKRENTIAFVGATVDNPDGLWTRSSEERDVKRAIIRTSGHVFVLVDHSKVTNYTKHHHCFARLNRRMTVITDRPGAMAPLRGHVKRIR